MIDLSDRITLMGTLPHGGRVIEVGVEQGFFSRVILKENQPRELYLVDAWAAQPGTEWQMLDPVARSDHEQNFMRVRRLFSHQKEVTILRALSVPAAALFADESLDIVYLDADHLRTAEDIAAWWPKIRPGGWLCGHDYTHGLFSWVTVKEAVDTWIAETGLTLLTTNEVPANEIQPSWAVQKSRSVPVYIVNRDRLKTTRMMVEQLQRVPGARPIIVDNASTYPPLLDWYETSPVEILRTGKNLGPRAPWLIGHPLMKECEYVVTDSDLDLSAVPIDALDVLRAGLEQYPDRVKAGLSLETCDLPQYFESTAIVQAWEAKFWTQRLDDGWWAADVDTTFALYRAGERWPGLRPALRADRPYTARHVPWYRADDDEERYYEWHADKRWATWVGWHEPNPAREAVIEILKR